MWLFAGLIIVLALFTWLIMWKKRTMKKMGDTRLVKLLVADFSSARFTSKFIVLSFAFALGIIAVMNPGKFDGTENINRKGIDVVIALDISKSMLATDMAPSRLDRAKQFITKLVDALPDDRIALVLFAGKAYLQMPLTVDHGATKMFVTSAGPGAVSQQGTVISEALRMGANAFSSADKRYKSIVLISDGEDHDAKAMGTAEELTQYGVMINTVGIGSQEGATITDPQTGELKKDESGNIVVSKLDEETLKKIASVSHGIYHHLDNSEEAVASVKGQLSKIEKSVSGDVSRMDFKTYYLWLVAGMFVLLLAENFLSERKKMAA